MSNQAFIQNMNRPKRAKRDDPQITVTGILKEGDKSDVIVFTIPLALFEIVCIVTIPNQGTQIAPVYCKFRVQRQGSGPHNLDLDDNENPG